LFFVVITGVMDCLARHLRNDLLCVEWDSKLYCSQ